MKIILIGTLASSLYVFRVDLIRQLIALGHEVYTFTSEYNEADLEKIQKLGAIPITYQLSRGGTNPASDIRATYELAKKIKKISPELVFSYFAKPVIFGTLAAKIAKVPRIIGMLEGLGYTFTDQPEGLSKKVKLIKGIQVVLYKLALPQLDSLIFLNPDDKKDLLEKTKDKLEIITTDVEKAVTLLEEKMGIRNLKVIDNHTIYLYEKIDKSGEINRALLQADIKIDSLSINRESLEEYFINLTGGGNHA